MRFRFIRLHFELTLKAFAEVFAAIHVAVLKGEKTSDKFTAIHWSTEKNMRIFIISNLNPNPKNFIKHYKELSKVTLQRLTPTSFGFGRYRSLGMGGVVAYYAKMGREKWGVPRYKPF